MHLFTRNVNTAFHELVSLFNNDDYAINGEQTCGVVRNQTRNGPVLRIDEPVTITYERPRERVLLNAARDANPFFHLYEALWMLAGRNDVAPLNYYNGRMKEFSDDGKTLNGAYGYRWRRASYENGPSTHVEMDEIDQLNVLVQHLKTDPNSRRAVLQMWNVEDDLLKIGQKCEQCGGTGVYKGRYTPDDPTSPYVEETCEDCDGDGGKGSKDVCCNLSVMFAVRNINTGPGDYGDEYRSYLDMTVTNRSNDLVWGLLGANYVHFTILQEYMAARLGAEVGRYNQFTNNLHVYESNWEPDRWLSEPVRDYPTKTVPLVSNPERFDQELPEFVEHHSGKIKAGDLENSWSEPFLATVAGPMLCAFACHKEKDYHGAFTMVDHIAAEDWRIASEGWIRRRYERSKR